MLATRRAQTLKEREAARKKTQAEQAEVQAALEAVAKMERKEREQRLLEEKEMIEKLETIRIGGITKFYESARQSLVALHELQLEKIKSRHKASISKIQRALKDVAFWKDTYIADESRLRLERRTHSKDLRQQYAREFLATFIRHRQDQDTLIAYLREHAHVLDENTQALQLQALVEEQDKERQIRSEQQRRQIEKLEARSPIGELDIARNERKLELEREESKLKVSKENLRRQILADGRWVALARTECLAMLNEDEQRLINSGADAPELLQQTGTQEREEVTAESSAMGATREAKSSAVRRRTNAGQWKEYVGSW